MLVNNTYQLSKIKKSLKTIRNAVIRERLIIIKRYYENQSYRKAAKQCGCSHMKVKNWKEIYESEGLPGLNPKPKSGRPPKLGKEQQAKIKRVIIRKANKQGWQTKQIRQYIKEQSGIKYSMRHTIRIAQHWGLSQIKPGPKYAYTNDRENQCFLKENR